MKISKLKEPFMIKSGDAMDYVDLRPRVMDRALVPMKFLRGCAQWFGMKVGFAAEIVARALLFPLELACWVPLQFGLWKWKRRIRKAKKGKAK